MAVRCAVDTNVLLRLSHRAHPHHSLIQTAIRRLALKNVQLCFTAQNAGEFWNVSTRPLDRNGFGLSREETEQHITAIEKVMELLTDGREVYAAWRNLLFSKDVRGAQVHDAHIAAVLQVHQVEHLLTFNVADFRRFPGLIAFHPGDVEPLY